LYYVDWSSILLRATGTRRGAFGVEAAIIDCGTPIQESTGMVDIVQEMRS